MRPSPISVIPLGAFGIGFIRDKEALGNITVETFIMDYSHIVLTASNQLVGSRGATLGS